MDAKDKSKYICKTVHVPLQSIAKFGRISSRNCHVWDFTASPPQIAAEHLLGNFSQAIVSAGNGLYPSTYCRLPGA